MKENPMEKEDKLCRLALEHCEELYENQDERDTAAGAILYFIKTKLSKSAEADRCEHGVIRPDCFKCYPSPYPIVDANKKVESTKETTPNYNNSNFMAMAEKIDPSPASVDELQVPESVTVNGVKFYSERKGLVLDKIDDLINVQRHSADSADYHHGMLNGLILAKSIIEDKTPHFYTRPDGRPEVPSVDLDKLPKKKKCHCNHIAGMKEITCICGAESWNICHDEFMKVLNGKAGK